MRKPIVHRIACAMIIFWNGCSGVLTAPPEFAMLPPSLNAAERSSESGPEPSAGCCVSVASFALSSGFVVPYAQMIVCDVLEALW